MEHVSPPAVDQDGPFQMRISQLDYNNFVGLIGVGRIQRGKERTNMPVSVIDRHGKNRQGEVQSGRASCRKRVWQYGSISVVAVSFKKTNERASSIEKYRKRIRIEK